MGPGNAYVAEAKRQVFGLVNIDMIAGPSEVLVIADGNSNPAWVAADLLSQAEHDKMASAVLVTDSRELAQAVSQEIEGPAPDLGAGGDRPGVHRGQRQDYRGPLPHQAAAVANRIAPGAPGAVGGTTPFDYLGLIENAGSIFPGPLQPRSPWGTTLPGPNHTLPTMGTARFYSPLSVDDFIKKSQFSYYTREALERDCRKVSRFAKEEGLTAHSPGGGHPL